MAIKVLIYEDNENLRRSIQTLLLWNDEFEVIAALENATGVKEDIAVLHPDVILMDIDMPMCNGVEAVRDIRSFDEVLPVIMFTVFEDEDNIYNAICAGANGYILKKNVAQLPDAIKDVINGGAPMTSSIARKVLSFIPKSKEKTEKKQNLDGLSKREIEILEYIVKGFSYKMIAPELNISLETVRGHIKNIYKKLQVNSATAAIYKYNQGK